MSNILLSCFIPHSTGLTPPPSNSVMITKPEPLSPDHLQIPRGGGAALSRQSFRSTLNPHGHSRSGHMGGCSHQATLMPWATLDLHLQATSTSFFLLSHWTSSQQQKPGLLPAPRVPHSWAGSSRPKLGLTRK